MLAQTSSVTSSCRPTSASKGASFDGDSNSGSCPMLDRCRPSRDAGVVLDRQGNPGSANRAEKVAGYS